MTSPRSIAPTTWGEKNSTLLNGIKTKRNSSGKTWGTGQRAIHVQQFINSHLLSPNFNIKSNQTQAFVKHSQSKHTILRKIKENYIKKRSGHGLEPAYWEQYILMQIQPGKRWYPGVPGDGGPRRGDGPVQREALLRYTDAAKPTVGRGVPLRGLHRGSHIPSCFRDSEHEYCW